jgi:hypothetical protein
MQLFQSSGDVLNIVKSVIYFFVGAFFAVFIYYLAMMMREVFLATKEMRARVHKIDEAITAFKQKIENSASYLLIIGEGVKKLAELAMKYWVKEKKDENKD